MYLWYLWLGHINLNRTQQLVKDGSLDSLKVEELPACESCLEGKIFNRSFKIKGNRAKETLSVIRSDVCGPMNTQAWL